MKRIAKRVRDGEILISDGAWGTYLHRKGLGLGECPELWCLDRRQDVLDIAKSYVEAGADMIGTNSFGGSRLRLDHFGLGDRVVEINKAAAQISREAAGPDRNVLASVGPTGKMLVTGEVTEALWLEVFAEQASALEAGGADVICIETMSALEEGLAAVRAAKANTSCEVICTFTFDRLVTGGYATMMGVKPSQLVGPLLEAGADVIGSNCGAGIEQMLEIALELRACDGKVPILVQANAGLPKELDGEVVFPESPELMASKVGALIEAGANIVGGCCGTTPDHIRAIKTAVANLRQ